MRDQEIIGLWEAYQQVHSQPQELTEEVEIAAQYFYEMGLNEDGVDILIEELGVEEFAEFVSDIAEEYVLTEARAGGAKIEPKLASGKAIQGKPKAASLKRLRAQKEARRESEAKASEAKPSGLKASLKRQSAVASAKKQQPKKEGILSKIGSAVSKGIERHNAANKSLNKAASETGKTLRKVGKAAATVARGVASGASGTARLAGHVASKGLKEEIEEWVDSLVEEGYDLSEYTWEDMVEIYLGEEYKDLPTGRMVKQAAKHGQRGGMAHMAQKKVEKTPKGLRTLTGSRERAQKLGNIKKTAYTKAAKMTVAAQEHDPKHSQAQASQNRARGTKSNIRPFTRVNASYEYDDLFDYLLEYLVAEGYAETNEAAIAIMTNMSEEWRNSIIEEETRRTEYLQKKFDKENAAKSGSAHTAIPGKQNTGQALYKARQSERQMRGEN